MLIGGARGNEKIDFEMSRERVLILEVWGL